MPRMLRAAAHPITNDVDDTRRPARSGEYEIPTGRQHETAEREGTAYERSADLFDLDGDDERADLALELDRRPPVARPQQREGGHALRVVDSYDFPDPARISIELEGAPRQLPHETKGMATARMRRGTSPRTAALTRAALAAFAGFGPPPASLLATPQYAIRVLVRRHALQRSLAARRRYRMADRPIYEAALDAADEAAVRTGLSLIAAAIVMLAVAAVVFWQSNLTTGV